MSRDWDWYQDDPTICVPEQAAVAVYPNTRDAVVIRQQAAWDRDEDTIIIIQARHAQTVARAILAAADGIRSRLVDGGDIDPEAPARKSGNAARQKRHRDKKRNAISPPDRNASDAEGVTRNDEPPPFQLRAVGDG